MLAHDEHHKIEKKKKKNFAFSSLLPLDYTMDQ
jgi:sterol desaturase/sphingolipid hydroxylase (fatty acid hydroxylase superfamily)